jgi:hypothetical protein
VLARADMVRAVFNGYPTAIETLIETLIEMLHVVGTAALMFTH